MLDGKGISCITNRSAWDVFERNQSKRIFKRGTYLKGIK